MNFRVPLCLAILAFTCLSVSLAAGLSDGPIISEFAASNSNGLADEDGSYEDWIEVHNPTASPVNLNGWYLTGNAADLDKWKFPSISLPANGYLVVFASNKNRRNPANPLHTNFKLSASGEYLALVKPDKVTIAWEYAPTFPPQLQNISYGVTPLQGDPTVLVATGTAGNYLIPTATPPTPWKLPSFVPGSGWESGSTGIGYANPTTQDGSARILFVVDTAATGIAAEGDQSILARLGPVLGHEVTVVDDGVVQSGDAAGKNLVIVSSSVVAGQIGTKLRGVPIPVINWERSLSDEFRISDSGAVVDAQTTFTLTAEGAAHPMGAGFSQGTVAVRTTPGFLSTASTSSLAAGATVIATASNGGPAIAVVNQGQMLSDGSTAPGTRIHFFLYDDGLVAATPQAFSLFDAAVAYALQGLLLPSKYAALIGTDVKAAMENTATSALLRHTFTPDSVGQFATLALRMKYDDGFVAWLNGTEIARRNAPAGETWNSAATADRPASASLAFEEIDISPHLGLLVAGQANVLAIHGLNQSSADGDFLILPELIARGPDTPFYQFYTIPTPGAPNNTSSLGIVPDVEFSADRGYFENSFSLALSVPLAGTVIRYTTDGTAPTATAGTVYTGPIPITDTAVIRAAGYRSGYTTLRPETRTFLKLSSIVAQPASVSGWPRPAINTGTSSTRIHDYEMDPEVVNDPAYADDLLDGLEDLPVMSVVVTKSDMWNPTTGAGGFYRLDDLEKAASIEFIHPADPSKNVQADCGIQGHSHDRMKRSLRLSFSSSFGESKFDSTLFTETPLHPGSGNPRVDNIILRAGNNRSFARVWNPTTSTYTEDEWYRSTQIAMGGPGSPGRFVHLYINGLYWGLYNAVQRPDADFASDRLGGTKDDWHSVNHSGTRSGDTTRWDYLKGALTNKNMSIPANYAELCQYLDPGAFIDYLFCAWYSGMADWPENNWWGGNSNNPAAPFHYFTWDGETSWGSGNGANPTAWVHPNFRTSSSDTSIPAVKIWHAARANPDFMALVADRLHKHTAPGGALSAHEAIQRWDTLNDHIRDAIVAESARWGDTMQEPPSRRDVEWQNEVTRIRNLMATGTANGSGTLDNGTILRNALRGQGYYPAIDPPLFAQNGGDIPEGYLLSIANPNGSGSIYYTLDGSDPRLSGGTISPSATLYAGPAPIGYTLAVKARVKNGNSWSALAEATFVSPARSPLRISEIMFNPPASTAGEMELGFTDDEDFEFLEFHNTGPHAIDLSGYDFANGVTFNFGAAVIPAGGFVVLARNPAAFAHRYGATFEVAGPFEGELSNTGDHLRLKNASDQNVIDFTFDDQWHPLADNGGHSLVPTDESAPPATLDTPAGWRASTHAGGSPGAADPPPDVIPPSWRQLYFNPEELQDPLLSGPDADFDHDGLSNVLEHAFGTDPRVPDGGPLKVEDGAIVSRGAPAILAEDGDYHFIFARRKTHAEDGWQYHPQTTTTLDSWSPLVGVPAVIAEDDDFEILSLPCPVVEGEPRFFRLEVIAP